MRRIKTRHVVLAAIVVLMLIVVIKYVCMCKVTDSNAIQITKTFYSKMNIKYEIEPYVPHFSIDRLIVFGLGTKPTIVGSVGDYKLIATIDCNNNEVIHFSNADIKHLYIKKYTETLNNRKELKWPPFIPEQSAKSILISFANKIGIPQDVEFSSIKLDKINGIWTARWKRKFNGIEFENDYVVISIMAIDGELYGFSKWLKGEPCSTEVMISKDEAIQVAHKKFADYFSKDTWEKNKDKFEVKSAELKIVQDKSNLKRILSLPNKTRLAWVVVFDTKEGMDRETIGILKEDLSFIRIDAATKKILSSEINVVQ